MNMNDNIKYDYDDNIIYIILTFKSFFTIKIFLFVRRDRIFFCVFLVNIFIQFMKTFTHNLITLSRH